MVYERTRPTGVNATTVDGVDSTAFELVARKGAASGYASLNGSSKVTEDPANATSTATASKIPIAGSNGRLASAWKPYQTVTSKVVGDSPYTAVDADDVILCNATGGAITVNLPPASAIAGKVYLVKKTDASANAVTIDANSAELIDGAATYALSTQYAAVIIICDGTGWQVF